MQHNKRFNKKLLVFLANFSALFFNKEFAINSFLLTVLVINFPSIGWPSRMASIYLFHLDYYISIALNNCFYSTFTQFKIPKIKFYENFRKVCIFSLCLRSILWSRCVFLLSNWGIAKRRCTKTRIKWVSIWSVSTK